MRRRFHALVRRTERRADGRPSVKLGMALGYWPCLHAPYIQLFLGTFILDLWHGERRDP